MVISNSNRNKKDLLAEIGRNLDREALVIIADLSLRDNMSARLKDHKELIDTFL